MLNGGNKGGDGAGRGPEHISRTNFRKLHVSVSHLDLNHVSLTYPFPPQRGVIIFD